VSVRTTLDIDEDVLQAAREIAAARNVTVSFLVSELLRTALVGPADAERIVYRNGFPQTQTSGPVVTVEMIEILLDADY
jgi:Family of unknown function (DUF6364)